MPTRADIDDFLAQRRIAFVGASRNPKHFNTNVYRALRDAGHEMIPIHPEAESIEGDRTYPSLLSVPATVDGVVLMVDADAVPALVEEAHRAGITRVWLHRGAGKGAVNEDAVAFCRERGMSVVDGACPYMFLDPVSGAHRFHRGWRKLTGSLPR